MEITTQDIIDAARHALRPNATEEDLEADAPRILAFACRQGLQLTHVALTGHVVDVFAARMDFIKGDRGDPCVWQGIAPLISALSLEGQPVL